MTTFDDGLDILVEKMAEQHQQAPATDERARHARLRARTLEAIASPPETTTPPWGWLSVGALLAVAVAVIVTWGVLRPVSLTFETASLPGQAQSYALVAATDEPEELKFSEGSVVRLRPRTRLRVGAAREEGVDLVLESGAIEIVVDPGSVASWRLEAGPYHVMLTGASISARWAEEEGTFELEPQQGRAMVRGPQIEGTRALDAGERLVIEAPRQAPTTVARAAPTDVEPPANEQPQPTDAQEHSPVVSVSRRRSPASRTRVEVASTVEADGWRELARAGAYKRALSAAETAGFSGLCATADAALLLELADVGRYAGRPARAKEALFALRRRFPGTNAAATAAFDLGRLAPAKGEHCNESTTWFRTYLREQPKGSMTGAALRRIEECTAAAGLEAESKP